MYEGRRKFPVFQQKKLEEILDRLGMLEQMQQGELRCQFCDRTVSEEDFGAIFLEGDTVRVSCSDLGCLEQISKVTMR